MGLTLRNLHRSAAPAGSACIRIFRAMEPRRCGSTPTSVWLKTGANSLPAVSVPLSPEWDHARGRRIGGASLDNCFAGWDGVAHIVRASDGVALRIEADAPFRHPIVYSPPGQDFFWVEPVSHMNDAINRMDSVPDHGLRILAPGGTLQGLVTFQFATAG